MLGSTNEGEERFNQGAGRYSLYVVVDDPDAHHARAKEAAGTYRPGAEQAAAD